MPIEDIVHQADYPQPPEVVWNVIATRQGLDSWFMSNDFEHADVGHEFSFRDRPRPFWDGTCDCRVVEADPPRRFAILWNHTKEKHPSTVTWTLEPLPDGGTRLTLRHSGLNGFMGLMMKRGMQKGWGRFVQQVIPFVAQEVAQGRYPTSEESAERFRRKPPTSAQG